MLGGGSAKKMKCMGGVRVFSSPSPLRISNGIALNLALSDQFVMDPREYVIEKYKINMSNKNPQKYNPIKSLATPNMLQSCNLSIACGATLLINTCNM